MNSGEIAAEAEKYADAGYNAYPIARAALPVRGADDVFRALRSVSNHVFLLESADDKAGTGRYTFLGFDPKLEIVCRNGTVTLTAGTKLVLENERPHEHIRRVLAEHRSPRLAGLPPFTGGLVGYFAYDFIKYSEPSLRLDALDDEGWSDVDLMLFDKIVAFDRLENRIYYIVNISLADRAGLRAEIKRAQYELDRMAAVCASEGHIDERARLLEPLRPLFDEREYCAMVEKAKRRIFEGDIFQVVLSDRWSARCEGGLFGVYRELRRANPSPYMFYFSSDDIELAGASPETLVRLENGRLLTYPLAGTRPRGRTAAEDETLERELLADEKELAEHNMLVDLGRNDLGKISEFGSVKVEKYLNVQRYSCVMHLGSTVGGRIRADKDALDAVDAVLPAGTLSGAPKLRACRIVNELENNKRGVYGGAVGYLAFNGDLDTCIAIRLAFKKNGRVFVRSGAGIVADSVAAREFGECVNKAKAVVRALEGGEA